MSSYGLWLAAQGMQVNEHRQNLLANNMANGQTTGFKQDFADIRQRQIESRENAANLPFVHPVLDGMSGGVAPRPTYHSFEQGAIERTGRDLDVAIDGEGFFTVDDGEAVRYTRDGVFTLSTESELVLAAGEGRWRVLDEGGDPVAVQPSLGRLRVSNDGTLTQGGNAIGRLQIVTNDDPQTLRKVGENLFDSAGADMRPAAGRLVAESRERSNFDMMQGLSSMIEVTRAYQLNATMIQLHDNLTGQAVSRVGRVG